jgi:hypothetical protein
MRRTYVLGVIADDEAVLLCDLARYRCGMCAVAGHGDGEYM